MSKETPMPAVKDSSQQGEALDRNAPVGSYCLSFLTLTCARDLLNSFGLHDLFFHHHLQVRKPEHRKIKEPLQGCRAT